MSKPLRAYTVHDGCDETAVVFATNSATARREGANEMNTDWYGVESCRRSPEFDEFAPGPIPPLAMIAAGWWFECHHCGQRVSDDMEDELVDEGIDPDGYGAVARGSRVFCSRECDATDLAQKRLRDRAVNDLIELVETKFSGCIVKDVYVYGHRLEPGEPRTGVVSRAYFTFPGAQYQSTYFFGEGDAAHVPQVDVDAFTRLYMSGGAA